MAEPAAVSTGRPERGPSRPSVLAARGHRRRAPRNGEPRRHVPPSRRSTAGRRRRVAGVRRFAELTFDADPRRTREQPAPGLRRGRPRRADPLDPRVRRSAAGRRPPRRPAAATSWSWASGGCGRPCSGPDADSGDRPRHRGRRDAAGRAAGEHPPGQLNPLEEAAAYQQLLEEFGVTHEELARRIGRSRSQVSNTIRLLNLPIPVQRRVAAGVLSAGHARALLGLADRTPRRSSPAGSSPRACRSGPPRSSWRRPGPRRPRGRPRPARGRARRRRERARLHRTVRGARGRRLPPDPARAPPARLTTRLPAARGSGPWRTSWWTWSRATRGWSTTCCRCSRSSAPTWTPPASPRSTRRVTRRASGSSSPTTGTRRVGVAGWRILALDVRDPQAVRRRPRHHRGRRGPGASGTRCWRSWRPRARAAGCTVIDLDSGVQRHDAHRFYFRERTHISSHHFTKALDR